VAWDYDSYLLGRYSTERLVQTINRILCRCPGAPKEWVEECEFGLAEAAPFIAMAQNGDCGEVDRLLNAFFAWYGVRWVALPCGEDPDVKHFEVRSILCSGTIVLDERFLRSRIARESGLGFGERRGEEEEVGEFEL